MEYSVACVHVIHFLFATGLHAVEYFSLFHVRRHARTEAKPRITKFSSFAVFFSRIASTGSSSKKGIFE